MPLLRPGRRLSRPRKLRPPLPQKARPRLRKTRSLPSPYRKPLLCRPCPRGLDTARPSRRKLSRPSKRPSMTPKTRGRACKGPPLLLSLSPRRPGAPVSSRLRQPCPYLLPAVGPCPPTIPDVRATAVPPHPGRRIRLGLTDRMPQHAPDQPTPPQRTRIHRICRCIMPTGRSSQRSRPIPVPAPAEGRAFVRLRPAPRKTLPGREQGQCVSGWRSASGRLRARPGAGAAQTDGMKKAPIPDGTDAFFKQRARGLRC